MKELQINQIVNFYPKGKKLGKMFPAKIVQINSDIVLLALNNEVYPIKVKNISKYID